MYIKKNTSLECQCIYCNTKVPIGETIFMSPSGDGMTLLYGHLSHTKVQHLQSQGSIFIPGYWSSPEDQTYDPLLCSQELLTTDWQCIRPMAQYMHRTVPRKSLKQQAIQASCSLHLLAPKNFLMCRIEYSSSVIRIPLKNLLACWGG